MVVVKSVAQRSPVRFTDVLLLEGEGGRNRSNFQNEEKFSVDDEESSTEWGGECAELAGRLHSLFPSVPSERHRSVRVHLAVVSQRNEATSLPGVEQVFCLGKGEEALLATQLGDLLLASTSLPSAMARTSIRELEELRPTRSALVDPVWIADIVDRTFAHIPPHMAIFPTVDGVTLDRLRIYIDEWNFYAPSLSRPELLTVILLIFERFDIFEALEIPKETFQQFILVVEHNYAGNPYHNFYHAIDVLQCCYYVLQTSLMLRRMFKPLDILALFVAALSHDVGHPSFNNPFLVEHDSLVAWLYNDRAVLENMHAAILFAMLRHPRYNFASRWARAQWKEFRSLVLAAVLGTDMAQHFEYIRQFSGIDGAFSRALKCLNSGGEGPLPLEDRRLLAVSIIKFADICNVVRPFSSARRWGFHLVCEFFHQGDWEKALGYQSTPLTLRSLSDLAKGQQYFLNNVAGPLYRCMAEHFSELYFAEEQLRANLEQWRTWRPETDDHVHSYAELYPLDRERYHSH